MNIGEYLSCLKLHPKYWFAIALIATTLIVAPSSVTNALGITSFVIESRMWIGIVCVVAWIILVTHILWDFKDRISDWLDQHCLLRAGKMALQHLTPEERLLLASFISKQSKTQTLRIQSGVVAGLEQAGILYRAASLGNMNGFDYNLQQWAWEELTARPELLDPELKAETEKLRQKQQRHNRY
jgi:hypothetical protein